MDTDGAVKQLYPVVNIPLPNKTSISVNIQRRLLSKPHSTKEGIDRI